MLDTLGFGPKRDHEESLAKLKNMKTKLSSVIDLQNASRVSMGEVPTPPQSSTRKS